MTLQNPPQPAVYDDEIDLRQFAATLWRRRALIAAVTIVCVAIAGGYSLLAPKMYESQAMIQVSDRSAPAYASPASAARVVGSLTFLGQVARAAGIADSTRVLQKRLTAEPIRDTPLVSIRVRARSPEEAQRLAETVAKAFVSAASEQVLERRRSAEQRLAGVNTQLAEIRRILEMSRQTLAQLQERRPLTGEQEGFIRAFTLNAVGISESLYSSLMAAQQDLTLELLSLQPPSLVEEPTLPDAPATPRPAMNVSVAFILGLLVAVVGVLVRESLQPVRQMTPSPQP